jgi:NAD(P)-dependent dehydrogenase (short-subunit alcohol dehydrogenase family)
MPASPPLVIVITGTTHGIGRVAAMELAAAGHRIVMLVRNPAAGDALAHEIRAAQAGAHVDVVACDLASLRSVQRAAEELRGALPRIDMLLNNAGTASLERATTVDGYERVFATNHLGPFLLTQELVYRIPTGGRIITVASRAHLRGRIDIDTLVDPPVYRPAAVYANSKLANVMHSMALARRVGWSGIHATCLHPGVVATNLLPRWLQWLQRLRPGRPVFDAVRGARTSLFLATTDDIARYHGAYVDEHQRPATPAPIAEDVRSQEILWRASEAWVAAKL